MYKKKRNPEGTTAINIPGWEDVIHINGPGPWTQAGATEYYAAKREKRPPNLSPVEVKEIRRREIQKDRMAQSNQPDYSQAMGSILTAIDNIQDFVSTVATFARLSLWGLPKITQWMSGAASLGTANATAEVARRAAEAAVRASFAEGLAARAAAGELLARLALNNPALATSAERAAIRTAGEIAGKLAFDRVMTGLAGRLVGRFVPIVGQILLASDVLNLLSLIGMMATPAYALACSGPNQALALGLPSALMKGALKREFWSMSRHNPFGMQARAARRLASVGRLPSFGNLLEVAQTTDQLFGVGLSLGGLVGFATEASTALFDPRGSQNIGINLTGEAQGISDDAKRKFNSLPPWKQRIIAQAGQVSTQANVVWKVQDVFTEEEHIWAAVASMAATAILYDFWQDLNLPTLAEALPDVGMRAPLAPAADTLEWARFHGLNLEDYRRWWFDGAHEWTTGAAYAAAHVKTIPAALHQFLEPRRNTPLGALYGTIVTQTNDWTWMLHERDPDLFHWELSTDNRLVASFTEAGWILPVNTNTKPLWRMWQAARARIELKGWTSLPRDDWAELAKAAGVVLMPALPPESPVPAGFAADVDSSLL
jgi:hypothetical protein